MERARQTFLVVIVVFAVLTGCKKKSGTPINSSNPADAPADLTMEKMHVQNFAPEGLAWDLRAPVARAFTKQNKMLAENMTVVLFKKNEKSTTITADTGTFNSAEGQFPTGSSFTIAGITLNPGDMYLQGHVVVVSTDGNKMLTDWAHYQRDFGRITSTAPVEVIRDDSITKGIGLEATADLSQVKIFKQTILIKERKR